MEKKEVMEGDVDEMKEERVEVRDERLCRGKFQIGEGEIWDGWEASPIRCEEY